MMHNMLLDTNSDFYAWHKSIFGLYAWYHSSYWDIVNKNKHKSNVQEFCKQNNIKI